MNLFDIIDVRVSPQQGGSQVPIQFKSANERSVRSLGNLLEFQRQVWDISADAAGRQRIEGAMRDYLQRAEHFLARGKPGDVSTAAWQGFTNAVARVTEIVGPPISNGGAQNGSIVGTPSRAGLGSWLVLGGVGVAGILGIRWLYKRWLG